MTDVLYVLSLAKQISRAIQSVRQKGKEKLK